MPKHPRRHKSVPSNRQGEDLPQWALSFDLLVRYVIGAWLGGVGLALFVVWAGLQDIITGHASYGKFVRIVLNGTPARVYGIAMIMFGASFHFFSWGMHERFWGTHKRLASFGNKAGIAAAAIGLTLTFIAKVMR